jgi:hypothetical protein
LFVSVHVTAALSRSDFQINSNVAIVPHCDIKQKPLVLLHLGYSCSSHPVCG